MADQFVVDCSTGDTATEPLTAEEAAERDALAAAEAERKEADAVAQGNRTMVEQGILDALSRLDTLIAAPGVDTVPAGTLTTAQLSNVVRAMRTAVQQNRDGAQEVAQVLKRTIRFVRGDFDGID